VTLYFVLILLTVPSIIALFEPVTSFFVWDKTAIEAGQWWRILTGNFAHTNIEHCVMNLAAMWLIALIFKPSGITFFFITLLINIGVGLTLLTTSIYQYVGLSGTLHGVFAYLTLTECMNKRHTSWLLIIGLLLKITWEQIEGSLPYSQSLIHAPVAIQAHLAGMVLGLLLAIIMRFSTKTTLSQA